MGKKNMRFRESSAYPEENNYRYRIEWEDRVSSVEESMNNGLKINHYGSGRTNVMGDFDNAWDLYKQYKKDYCYKNVKLIKIDKNGNESISHQ